MRAGFALSCANGHHFDANKRGHLTTLDSSKGITGDPRELLEARAAFLARGHYAAIAEAIAGALPHRPLSILDAGAGTGYYLNWMLRSQGESDALVLDASAAAVGFAAAATGSPGLVADTWQPLAIRDARADAILCAFAPRNPAEFARILRPGGTLVVVTPGPHHLQELRAAGLVIGMQEDKLDKLSAALGTHFTRRALTQLNYTVELSTESARQLTTMGPSGHHEPTGAWPGGPVTIDVDITSWRLSAQ